MRNSNHRREPAGPWSPGRAFIRWPDHVGQDGVIVIAYHSEEKLIEDYRRAAEWRLIPGTVAQGISLYLEKTRAGIPWINVGIRQYSTRRPRASRKSHILEETTQRINVQVHCGGRNRKRAISKTSTTGDLWLDFSQQRFCDRDATAQIMDDLFEDLDR